MDPKLYRSCCTVGGLRQSKFGCKNLVPAHAVACEPSSEESLKSAIFRPRPESRRKFLGSTSQWITFIECSFCSPSAASRAHWSLCFMQIVLLCWQRYSFRQPLGMCSIVSSQLSGSQLTIFTRRGWEPSFWYIWNSVVISLRQSAARDPGHGDLTMLPSGNRSTSPVTPPDMVSPFDSIVPYSTLPSGVAVRGLAVVSSYYCTVLLDIWYTRH